VTYRNPKLLSAARDRPCVLCGSVGTTVAAHSNSLEHGRGMGHKAPDWAIAYVCQSCHDQIDGRSGGLSKDQKRELWLRAFVKTVGVWFLEGIVK
jgi:hypothetical protein